MTTDISAQRTEQRIAEHAGRIEREMGGPKFLRANPANAKPITLVRLTDGTRFKFDSRKAACAFAGVNPTNLYIMLRRHGNVWGGYRWERA